MVNQKSYTQRANNGWLASGPDGLYFVKLPAIVSMCAVAFVMGGIAGALAMRQYAHGKDTLVSVNGAVIRRADYVRRLDTATRGSVLGGMVSDELTLQLARRKGLFPTADAVARRRREMETAPGFAQRSAAGWLNDNDVSRIVTVELARESIEGHGSNASDAEIEQVYRANIDPRNLAARFYSPESASISVIVTPSKDDAANAARLLTGEVSFADAARQFSHDKSRMNGGLIPPIIHGRVKLTALDNLVFTMSPGQTTPPTQIAGVWWIVRCNGRTPAVTRPLADVRDECAAIVQAAKERQLNGYAADMDLREFQRHSKIVVFDPKYNRLFDEAAQND